MELKEIAKQEFLKTGTKAIKHFGYFAFSSFSKNELLELLQSKISKRQALRIAKQIENFKKSFEPQQNKPKDKPKRKKRMPYYVSV